VQSKSAAQAVGVLFAHLTPGPLMGVDDLGR
jgi:hypothetical protein